MAFLRVATLQRMFKDSLFTTCTSPGMDAMLVSFSLGVLARSCHQVSPMIPVFKQPVTSKTHRGDVGFNRLFALISLIR